MSFNLPSPLVKDTETQRNFDKLKTAFPLATSLIADDAITAAKIAPDAVGSSEIAAGAVGSDELAANAVSNIYVGTATTSGPTTTSTADPMTAVIPEMTLTQDFGGDPLLISFSTTLTHSTTANLRLALYDGAGEIATSRRSIVLTGTTRQVIAIPGFFYQPAAGSRTISARWTTNTGTMTAELLERNLTILRLKA